MTSPQQPSAPPLAFSLWAQRERLSSTEFAATMYNIAAEGFKQVEIAGFFNRPAEDLRLSLKRNHLSVCGIHGPTVDLNRPDSLYVDWAIEYTDFFQTNTLGIESLPPPLGKVYDVKRYKEIAQSVKAIARQLAKRKLRVSYHCFPHDFDFVEGKPLVTHLFDEGDTPNLGLQLDTFWLHRGKVELSPVLLALPLHSVHVSERKDNGKSAVLSQRCWRYITAIEAKAKNVSWILECESVLGAVDHTAECVVAWQKFWQIPAAMRPMFSALPAGATAPAGTPPPAEEASPVRQMPTDETREIGRVFKPHIERSITGPLLGNESSIPVLAKDDPRVAYYVTKRLLPSVSGLTPLAREAEFHLLFWPPNSGRQIIQVVGGAGAGKTTFLRYYFQYYLPYGPSPQPQVNKGHLHEVRRHIVLYADLLRTVSDKDVGIKPFLYGKVRAGIESFLRDQPGVKPSPSNEAAWSDEKWVKDTIAWLAEQEEEGFRKWYISLVLDNSDQLLEKEQRQLLHLIHELVPEDPPAEGSDLAVTSAARHFWRVIVPVRPETSVNHAKASLGETKLPVRNIEVFNLGQLEEEEFLDKRGKLLHYTITASKLHVGVEVCVDPMQAHFDIRTPGEIAHRLRQAWNAGLTREVNGVEVISPAASDLLRKLGNGSARIRLKICSRAALSRPYRERLHQALAGKWTRGPLVSDFFLLDGLICGDSGEFEEGVVNLPVLNFFNLGGRPGSARSICVGLHALYLLTTLRKESHGHESWPDVKDMLRGLGYSPDDISSCERALIGAEFIKPLWEDGGFIEELPMIEGHWDLLKEQAYVDCMSVHCSQQWRRPDLAVKTDSLNYGQLPQRTAGSVRFLREIWKAEKDVCGALNPRGGRGTAQPAPRFSGGGVHLPSISARIARQYMKCKELIEHDNIRQEVESTPDGLRVWQTAFEELAALLGESEGVFHHARFD